jgi:predicted aspartyl protease
VSIAFDLTASLVVVPAVVHGPRDSVRCLMGVNTGATGTHLSHHILRLAGYDVSAVLDPVNLNTAGGVVRANRLRVDRLSCLGQRVDSLRVVCHTISTTARIDGLLGLDFLRGRILTLDFARGRIALRTPGPWWAFWR